jgi:hypothetical protein
MFNAAFFDKHTDRELLIHLLKGLHAMALDLSALTAAVAKLSTDVTALVTADQTALNAHAAGMAEQLAADQAAVNAVTPSVSAISAVAEAALTPPVVVPPAPPPAPPAA